MGVKRIRRGIERFTEHAEVGFLVKKPIYNKRRRKSRTRCLISKRHFMEAAWSFHKMPTFQDRLQIFTSFAGVEFNNEVRPIKSALLTL